MSRRPCAPPRQPGRGAGRDGPGRGGPGRARRCPVAPGGLEAAAAMGEPGRCAAVLLPLLCLCAALPGSASNKGERRSAAGAAPGAGGAGGGGAGGGRGGGGGGGLGREPSAAARAGAEGLIRPPPRCPSPSSGTFLSGNLRAPPGLRLPLYLRARSAHPLSLLSPSASWHRCVSPFLAPLLAFPPRFPPFHPLVLLLFQLPLCGFSFPPLPWRAEDLLFLHRPPRSPKHIAYLHLPVFVLPST